MVQNLKSVEIGDFQFPYLDDFTEIDTAPLRFTQKCLLERAPGFRLQLFHLHSSSSEKQCHVSSQRTPFAELNACSSAGSVAQNFAIEIDEGVGEEGFSYESSRADSTNTSK